MKTDQSKCHTESKTFDIPEEVLRSQCGLGEDWHLTWAKPELETGPPAACEITVKPVLKVRFERKVTEETA